MAQMIERLLLDSRGRPLNPFHASSVLNILQSILKYKNEIEKEVATSRGRKQISLQRSYSALKFVYDLGTR